MKRFNFNVPQDIRFGRNSLHEIADIMEKNNYRKAMIISDRGLEQLGFVAKIGNILKDAGIDYCAYLDVEPNPTTDMVAAALSMYRESGAECMIALGGGSPMDVSKAVGIVARYGKSITDYEGAQLVPGPIEPVIAIPTTAGTGSEVTPFSVIIDAEKNYKFSVYSYEILPGYALLDSGLIMTAPASVAASCGLDAFIHAFEAYISLRANPFTDAMAEKALELIGRNLRAFVANRKNEEAADAMMLGSMFAGLAFAWARTGDVHAMSLPLSAMYGVPHGVANAILLPAVAEFNALADVGRYRKVYGYLCRGSRTEEDFEPRMLVDEIKALCRDFNIPERMSEVGVRAEDIREMAESAMKSGNILVNPRQTSLRDVIKIYEAIL